jgi:hypothetical protein
LLAWSILKMSISSLWPRPLSLLVFLNLESILRISVSH